MRLRTISLFAGAIALAGVAGCTPTLTQTTLSDGSIYNKAGDLNSSVVWVKTPSNQVIAGQSETWLQMLSPLVGDVALAGGLVGAAGVVNVPSTLTVAAPK